MVSSTFIIIAVLRMKSICAWICTSSILSPFPNSLVLICFSYTIAVAFTRNDEFIQVRRRHYFMSPPNLLHIYIYIYIYIYSPVTCLWRMNGSAFFCSCPLWPSWLIHVFVNITPRRDIWASFRFHYDDDYDDDQQKLHHHQNFYLKAIPNRHVVPWRRSGLLKYETEWAIRMSHSEEKCRLWCVGVI